MENRPKRGTIEAEALRPAKPINSLSIITDCQDFVNRRYARLFRGQSDMKKQLLTRLAMALLLPLSLGLSLSMSFEAADRPARTRPLAALCEEPSGRWSRSPLNQHEPSAPAPEPTPEHTPEPMPEPTLPETLLAGMSLREKLCQMLIVHPTDLSTGSKTKAAADMAEALAACPVGGIFFNGSNMTSREQITAMTSTLQDLAAGQGIPGLLTVCDEEGGRVARLMNHAGTRRIGPMLSYEDEGGITAFSNAETIAEDMLSCGFNLDFAPVADVWSNPKNTVIGDRAYSTDFELAAWLVKNAVYGFHSGGVACTLKHFPGHGDTAEDSHDGAAYLRKTLDELRCQEFLPFAAGIQAGADLVMVGHITAPAVSEEPALFSGELLVLRRDRPQSRGRRGGPAALPRRL